MARSVAGDVGCCFEMVAQNCNSSLNGLLAMGSQMSCFPLERSPDSGAGCYGFVEEVGGWL